MCTLWPQSSRRGAIPCAAVVHTKEGNVMVKFILKRIGTMIIAMFMIILITFTLMHSIPGGPFTNTKGVPEEVTQAMEAKYGLDQPMPVQFVKYLGSLLHGDFGPSYK